MKRISVNHLLSENYRRFVGAGLGEDVYMNKNFDEIKSVDSIIDTLTSLGLTDKDWRDIQSERDID